MAEPLTAEDLARMRLRVAEGWVLVGDTRVLVAEVERLQAEGRDLRLERDRQDGRIGDLTAGLRALVAYDDWARATAPNVRHDRESVHDFAEESNRRHDPIVAQARALLGEVASRGPGTCAGAS